MQLRNISRIIVIALVALVGAVAIIRQQVVAHQSGGANATAPVLTGGTPLNSATPAFTLHDQTGAVVTPQSLRGHPIILTFMDMTCTQECPVIAQELQLTSNFAGAQSAGQTEWIVVSVNPNNTPADVTAFLTKQNVSLPVKVLLGTQAELSPVWKAFGIDVQPSPTDVTHTTATFLIDQRGTERMVFLDAFDAKALAGDISTLLAAK